MVYSFQVVWKKFHGFLSINSHITKKQMETCLQQSWPYPPARSQKLQNTSAEVEYLAAHHLQEYKEAARGTTSLPALSQHKTMATCHCLFTKNIHSNNRTEENTTTASRYGFLQLPSLSAGGVLSCFASFCILLTFPSLYFPCSCYCSLHSSLFFM